MGAAEFGFLKKNIRMEDTHFKVSSSAPLGEGTAWTPLVTDGLRAVKISRCFGTAVETHAQKTPRRSKEGVKKKKEGDCAQRREGEGVKRRREREKVRVSGAVGGLRRAG